ncbi:MAG: outer membrane beta-barrel protein [Anaeromyxobacter sp.]
MGVNSAGRVAGGLVALALALPAAASPGNGIRLGGTTGVLHPYLELESRYDSNVEYTEAKKPVGDLILHIRPGLKLSAPGELTSVDLDANIDWNQYLGVEDDTSTDLSRLEGAATLGLGINKRGAVSFLLQDAFRRSSSTQAFTLGTAVISNSNEVSASVPWRPGGGALVVTPGGSWRLETFEPYYSGALCDPATGGPGCDPDYLAKLGYNEYAGNLELRWKFLPRTAAVLFGEYFSRSVNDDVASSDGDGFRALAGLAGLFSTHVAGTAKAGFGQAKTDAGADASTWLANLEVEWLPNELNSVKGGYVRDVGLDPGQRAGYSTQRLYLEARTLLGARYTARLAGSFERRDYPSVAASSADLLEVEPSVEAELSRWLRAGLGYAYTKRTTDLGTGVAALPGYNYDKNEVWLRFTGTY